MCHESQLEECMYQCSQSIRLLKPPHNWNWHNQFVTCLQVAGMVAIFQAQKRRMRAHIDQHREVVTIITLQCVLCSCWTFCVCLECVASNHVHHLCLLHKATGACPLRVQSCRWAPFFPQHVLLMPPCMRCITMKAFYES
jgi:hypothetical protein